MKLADRQLRDTSIRAPFDGYVQRRMVSLGEFVKNQTPVMSVVEMDPLKVTARDPREDGALDCSVGQPVAISVDAFPDATITGKVSRISPSVNTATRAFPFEALVPNADSLLKPGTFVRVHVESSRVDTVVMRAVFGHPVPLRRQPRLRRRRRPLSARELKVGDRFGDRIEVVGGVKSGELVAMTDPDNCRRRWSPKRLRSRDNPCCPNSASAARSSPPCS